DSAAESILAQGARGLRDVLAALDGETVGGEIDRDPASQTSDDWELHRCLQHRRHRGGILGAKVSGPAAGEGQRGSGADGHVLAIIAPGDLDGVSARSLREAIRDRKAGADAAQTVVGRVAPRGGDETVGRLALARAR